MSNPLYNMYAQPVMNPMQKMNMFMQAISNPAAFVRQKFPDIPNEISNNPMQIMQYLQQSRGISDSQMQQIQSQAQGMYSGLYQR